MTHFSPLGSTQESSIFLWLSHLWAFSLPASSALASSLNVEVGVRCQNVHTYGILCYVHWLGESVRRGTTFLRSKWPGLVCLLSYWAKLSKDRLLIRLTLENLDLVMPWKVLGLGWSGPSETQNQIHIILSKVIFFKICYISDYFDSTKTMFTACSKALSKSNLLLSL